MAEPSSGRSWDATLHKTFSAYMKIPFDDSCHEFTVYIDEPHQIGARDMPEGSAYSFDNKPGKSKGKESWWLTPSGDETMAFVQGKSVNFTSKGWPEKKEGSWLHEGLLMFHFREDPEVGSKADKTKQTVGHERSAMGPGKRS